MSHNDIPSETRYRLREYLHETVHLRNTEQHAALLQKLPPAMQDEVAWLVNEGVLRRVWYLRHVASSSTQLLMKLASALKPLVFVPGELCPVGFLYFIKRGQVCRALLTRASPPTPHPHHRSSFHLSCPLPPANLTHRPPLLAYILTPTSFCFFSALPTASSCFPLLPSPAAFSCVRPRGLSGSTAGALREQGSRRGARMGRRRATRLTRPTARLPSSHRLM